MDLLHYQYSMIFVNNCIIFKLIGLTFIKLIFYAFEFQSFLILLLIFNIHSAIELNLKEVKTCLLKKELDAIPFNDSYLLFCALFLGNPLKT